MPYRVAFLGFTEFERQALTSYFRLAHNRSPGYEHVATLTDADLLVADADHAPSVQLVLVTERLDETVFIGAQAPAGGKAWLMRPIDALRVMRELDTLVARLTPARPARDDGGQHTTIIQAMRRQHAAPPAPAAPGAPAMLLVDLPFSTPDPAGTAAVPPPAASAWPADRTAAPLPTLPALPAAPPAPAAAWAAEEAAAPDPLTLRDPTPDPGEPGGPPLPGLFAGAEGLIGHEPPLPAQPGGWTEDLEPLPVLPLLNEVVSPLPPGAAPVAAPVKAPKPPKVPKAVLLSGTPRALLVDDSAIALLFLDKRLERWQVQTDHASNSQAALALLAQHSYDLVFLDVELGEDSEFDGLGLCRQIKQTPASMNAMVVMVTAHHTELDRVRGSLAGCDAYLGKPLNDAELQRLLQRQGLRPKAEAGSVPG